MMIFMILTHSELLLVDCWSQLPVSAVLNQPEDKQNFIATQRRRLFVMLNSLVCWSLVQSFLPAAHQASISYSISLQQMWLVKRERATEGLIGVEWSRLGRVAEGQVHQSGTKNRRGQEASKIVRNGATAINNQTVKLIDTFRPVQTALYSFISSCVLKWN